jgi:hypothetical protein
MTPAYKGTGGKFRAARPAEPGAPRCLQRFFKTNRGFAMTRIGFGVLAALMLAATVADAQQPPAPNKMQIAEACGGDIDRLCPGVPPGQGRIKACMKAHVSQLSAACFDTLMAAAAAKKEQ